MSPKKSHLTVVITGASAGVGRATAQAFARQGACIGLLARGKERLEQTAKEVRALGGKALVLPTDVSDPEQVEIAAQKTEETFGPIDIWVNNAMVTVFSPVKEMTAQEYKRVTEVTYLGYVNGTLSALKRMLPRDKGQIIQVGSALAYRSIPLQSAYCAAKHAIAGFTESLRCELLHDKSKVHVGIIQMPALNTPQFSWVKNRLPKHPQPVPPIFQPEVAAAAILSMARNPRREMYVAFSTTKAIWADKIAPGLADHYLATYGYKEQLTDEIPNDPQRPNNLWQPVDGNFGARGVFSHRSKDQSWNFWLVENKLMAGLVLSFAALILLL